MNCGLFKFTVRPLLVLAFDETEVISGTKGGTECKHKFITDLLWKRIRIMDSKHCVN